MKLKLLALVLAFGALAFIVGHTIPVAVADGGPIPMCGPPGDPKCEKTKPHGPDKPSPCIPVSACQ